MKKVKIVSADEVLTKKTRKNEIKILIILV
jgi:hypothetical protein